MESYVARVGGVLPDDLTEDEIIMLMIDIEENKDKTKEKKKTCNKELALKSLTFYYEKIKASP